MMVREYLKSVLHEIEEQRKANTAEIEEQRLEKETIDKRLRESSRKKNSIWNIFHREGAKVP